MHVYFPQSCFLHAGACVSLQWEMSPRNQEGSPERKTCLLLWLYKMCRGRNKQRYRSNNTCFCFITLLFHKSIPTNDIYLFYNIQIREGFLGNELCSFSITNKWHSQGQSVDFVKVHQKNSEMKLIYSASHTCFNTFQILSPVCDAILNSGPMREETPAWRKRQSFFRILKSWERCSPRRPCLEHVWPQSWHSSFSETGRLPSSGSTTRSWASCCSSPWLSASCAPWASWAGPLSGPACWDTLRSASPSSSASLVFWGKLWWC